MSSSGTSEAVKCRCGSRMMPTATGRGVVCPNCDQCQPQEAFGISRRITSRDIKYDMYWLQVINNEYEDNTEPEVTAPEVGEEPPAETEGDQDGNG